MKRSSDQQCLRPLPALSRPRQDQVALELIKADQHSQHQPSVRGCCIRPRIAERPERCASPGDLGQGVEQITNAARQPVELGDDQSMAFSQRSDCAGQGLPIRDRRADLLSKHSLASSERIVV